MRQIPYRFPGIFRSIRSINTWSVAKPVEIIDKITPKKFKNYITRLPVAVTNGADYPAFTKWNFEYLTEKLSVKPAKLFAFDVDNNYIRKELKNVNYKVAMNLIQNNKSKKEKYYILRQSLLTDLPELSKDIFVPDWLSTSINQSPNLWVGESGSKTPLHYDSTHGLLIQTLGIKEIILFPKEASSVLEINNPFSGGRFNFNIIKHVEDFPNCSEEFFKKYAYRCILKSGMMLYIPRVWWHQVNLLTASISGNYFWNDKNSPAIDSTCKNYILMYQATRLHEFEKDRNLLNLINDCSYDNIQSTVEQIFLHKNFYFCVMLSGIIVQEMFVYLDKVFRIGQYTINLDSFDFISELTKRGGNEFFIEKETLTQWQRMIQLAFTEDNGRFSEKKSRLCFEKYLIIKKR